MNWLDWLIVIFFCVGIMIFGLLFKKVGSKDTLTYFVAGRKLPWWLMAFSLAATDFGSDTPLHMSGMARRGGIMSCWLYFREAITQVFLTCVFAKYWRRSRVVTDVEYYELRHGGVGSKVLRGVLGGYYGMIVMPMRICIFMQGMQVLLCILFGVQKNDIISCPVIGGIPIWLAISLVLTILGLVYAVASGLLGVSWTDLIEFIVMLFGVYALLFYSYAAVGGVSGMREGLHKLMADKGSAFDLTAIFPQRDDFFTFPFLFIILIYWWSTEWVDGKEFQAQRILAARSEREAAVGYLWNIITSFVIRSWPWYITGLISLILLPELGNTVQDHENAYPLLVMKLLPHGMLGLIFVSFFYAYLSSADAVLNCGAAYLVNDLYRRFLVRGRSDQHYLGVSRIATILVCVISILLITQAISIIDTLLILMKLGAGYGLFRILRWFWWRVNSWTELAAIVSGFLWTFLFAIIERMPDMKSPTLWVIESLGLRTGNFAHDLLFFAVEYSLIGSLTIITSLIVMLLTPSDDIETLKEFFRRVKPPGPGWRKIAALCPEVVITDKLSRDFVSYLIGLVLVLSAILGFGYILLGEWLFALLMGVVCAIATMLFRGFVLARLKTEHEMDDENVILQTTRK